MRRLFTNPLVVAAVAASISATACSKGSSTGSPLAPSTSAAASASPAPSPTPAPVSGGATIAGMVVTGAQTLTSGFSLRAAAVGRLNVTVLGTSASTVTDDNGNFTLQNVPAGSQTLSINGNGIAAQVSLTGVAANEQIRITVRVEGSGATLDDRQREAADNQVEVEGLISSASGGTIVVGRLNTSVVVPSTASITRAGVAMKVADLVAGVRVEVHGMKSGSVITATSVTMENTVTSTGSTPVPDDSNRSGSNNDATQTEVSGTLAAKPSGTCPAIAFQVGATAITTSASTQFDDAVCGSLAAGDTVRVEGVKQTNGSVLAREVTRTASASGAASGSSSGDDKGGSGGSGSNSGGGSGSGSNGGGSGSNSGGGNGGSGKGK